MRTYFIQTFWCQMNQADSEKIHMVFLQSGFCRAWNIQSADIVIFNTCSVRQKWEDRVFGMMRDLARSSHKPLFAITGCMVRKTGLAKRYLPTAQTKTKKKNTTKHIQLLDHEQWIYNSEDTLFVRSEYIDCVFRIEETRYIPHILSHIYGEKIGQEDKYDDYLKQVQQRENPFSASVIIQTGCDNYCTFCIVPYTRWGEISRPEDDIINECQDAVSNGAKEITLLGQNVNSYGKQKNSKLWNSEKSRWNTAQKTLKIGVDLDDTLFVVLSEEVIQSYNAKYHKILELDDVRTFNCNGIPELMQEYHNYEQRHRWDMSLHENGKKVLQKLYAAGHKIYVITSRPAKERKTTEALLEKYFWKWFFSQICFVSELGHDNKYEIANTLQLDVVIDDGPHHIRAYQKNFSGKICIFTQPWNKTISEDGQKTYRVNCWNEFAERIESFQFYSPFRSLLEKIDTLQGLDRIRFTSSNPHDMTRDILDAHSELSKTCNYLHFALQSWNNKMLKKMNRRHSYEDFRDMVTYLRKKDPLFSISTDIIVWFSGETDEMFEDTVRAFRECMFDFCYTARYSVRPNTLAAKVMPDNVPESVKAERWHILNDLLLENISQRNELMLGRVEKVLISWKKDAVFFGRTRNFKEVFFEAPESCNIWDLVDIKITDRDRYVLKGKYTNT